MKPMAIHRPLWHRTTPKDSIPGLPCPRCATGKLKLSKDGIRIKEPKHSKNWRENNWDEWEPDHNIERWSAELICDEASCGDIVNMIGDVQVVQAEIDLGHGKTGWGMQDVLCIQAVFPAPPLFRFADGVPHSVARELEVAARMYWTDVSACVARLRTAVERLLDHQKVPKEKLSKKAKLIRMDLKERIDAFTSGAVHADQLQGLRNIGNLGTHGGGDVTDEDLFDSIDVLQFVLSGIYETQTINAKASKLKGKKSGD